MHKKGSQASQLDSLSNKECPKTDSLIYGYSENNKPCPDNAGLFCSVMDYSASKVIKGFQASVGGQLNNRIHFVQ